MTRHKARNKRIDRDGRSTSPPAPMLLRRRESALILGVSESQVFKWERAGILPAIVIPGIRAVRNRASDVRSLADNIARGQLCIGEGK